MENPKQAVDFLTTMYNLDWTPHTLDAAWCGNLESLCNDIEAAIGKIPSFSSSQRNRRSQHRSEGDSALPTILEGQTPSDRGYTNAMRLYGVRMPHACLGSVMLTSLIPFCSVSQCCLCNSSR